MVLDKIRDFGRGFFVGQGKAICSAGLCLILCNGSSVGLLKKCIGPSLRSG